ncbi:hypothetical protein CPC08DRAFT_273912 [Agrocybe pediades]|nr:hypothetical protein CPC08DRAFT_273912 [Agrocybe pediades]
MNCLSALGAVGGPEGFSRKSTVASRCGPVSISDRSWRGGGSCCLALGTGVGIIAPLAGVGVVAAAGVEGSYGVGTGTELGGAAGVGPGTRKATCSCHSWNTAKDNVFSEDGAAAGDVCDGGFSTVDGTGTSGICKSFTTASSPSPSFASSSLARSFGPGSSFIVWTASGTADDVVSTTTCIWASSPSSCRPTTVSHSSLSSFASTDLKKLVPKHLVQKTLAVRSPKTNPMPTKSKTRTTNPQWASICELEFENGGVCITTFPLSSCTLTGLRVHTDGITQFDPEHNLLLLKSGLELLS